MQSVGDIWLWGSFSVLVVWAFFIDLRGMMRHTGKVLPVREALSRSIAWISLALFFLLFLWVYLFLRVDSSYAMHKSAEFLTAYILEKSLSVDNLFVILLIFQTLKIPDLLQRRVLFWGVLGAAFFRFIMIFLGIWFVHLFHWLLYVFGVFIVYSGIQMLFHKQDDNKNPAEGWLYRFVARRLPLLDSLRGEHFFIKENNKWWVTPLFFALVLVEISDLIFAVDSIPAVFAITLDPFIAFTSNMFAVLGLRALYFLLMHAANKISGLNIGIALVLIITGLKMLVEKWIKVPSVWMLLVVVGILCLSGWIGWLRKKNLGSAK